MNIEKKYNPETGNYEFDLFQIVHSMVGGQITLKNDEFTYHDKQTPPTESEIKTEKDRLESEWDAQAYARKRAIEYPSIPDQLDEIYHNGINSWKAVIKVTKDKYPKG